MAQALGKPGPCGFCPMPISSGLVGREQDKQIYIEVFLIQRFIYPNKPVLKTEFSTFDPSVSSNSKITYKSDGYTLKLTKFRWLHIKKNTSFMSKGIHESKAGGLG